MHKLLLIFLLLSIGAQTQAQTPIPEATVPDSTKLEIVHAEKAVYPMMAAQKGIQGRVVVKITVNEAGKAEKVELVSGDPMLKDAALSAAKKFSFKPFIRGGRPIRVSTNIPFDFAYSQNVENMPAAKAVDLSKPAQRVQLSQGLTEGLLLRKVTPVYPADARMNHVQGKVVLQAVIGRDGNIADLKPISGPSELIPAAMSAVQMWRYRPYELNGEPVEVDTQITVNFILR